jgi:hypothetical protein
MNTTTTGWYRIRIRWQRQRAVAVLECGRRFADPEFAKTTWEAAKYS